HSVYEHGLYYICEKAVGTEHTCDFKTGKIILNRPIEQEQIVKLLQTGKTDLLNKFISKKGRPFSAYLVIGAGGKIGFEFEQKAVKAKEANSDKPKIL
ncbi:MAG: topoisomerase C-terminal repeat-containing protein, partial [Nitrosomonas sp.]|nr:topoisomerase C-terminal repeat-containing protein [Nitrosomonas sp.]